MINLFKTEVPEISEGIVKVMGASREPGSRAKVAVSSSDTDIDPVGACVGMKGSRVQNVVQELRGEKIDIISWHVDAAKFVCNALAPAEISRVIIDEENSSMEVIVPDEFLSVAIGKRGQNVRLASKLTGWRLDVMSETRYGETMKDGYDSLVGLPGVGVSMADALYEKGFFSAEELSKAAIEDLTQIRGIGDEKAKKLIGVATDTVAISGAPGEDYEPVSSDEDGNENLNGSEEISAPEAIEEPTVSDSDSIEKTTAQEISVDDGQQET